MSIPEKMVPQNVEAEEAVLGALLIDPEGIFRVLAFLRAEQFYLQKHRWIYEAVVAIHERREPLDYLTLTTELERREQLEATGGGAYISQLINSVPSAINIESYGRMVEQAYVRRRLLDAAGDIARLAYDEEQPINEVVDSSENALFAVSQQRATRDLRPIQEVVSSYFDHVENLREHRGELMGVTSGFRDLDLLLGGFQRSDLLILAARPGVGKTSLMLTMAVKAAEKGRTVAVFSLEMAAEQIVQRMVSGISKIDAHRLRLGEVRDDEWPVFIEAIGHLADLSIYIDDTPALTPIQLRTKCRRLHSERGLHIVFVDYLQLMTSGRRSENRVQEVSYLSRTLKALARELDVPVMTASQLSRAVEQRQDKVPILSDLRESGCLTGDTLIQLYDGRRTPIKDLVTAADNIQVMALNEETWTLEPARLRKAWYTGVKPVFRLRTQLGRSVRASANHRFLTPSGWRRLDQLQRGDFIALPRTWEHLDARSATLTESQVSLLGHLLGDGCTLPRHAIQYTTNDKILAECVANLAKDIFGAAINPRIERQRQWWQVFLSATAHLTHGIRNPVAEWLDELGIWGLRSYEKRVPELMFVQPQVLIAHFLRHLWATDGTLGVFGQKKPRPIVQYASSSAVLACDVQHLLMRLGIPARVRNVPQSGRGRDQWHVIVTGQPDVLAFLDQVGVVGPKAERMEAIRSFYQGRAHNPNRDVVPAVFWYSLVEPARREIGMSQRAMQAALGMAYCGTSLYNNNMSRERAARVGDVVQSSTLVRLSQSDVYWDKIALIEPDGEAEVYDLEVPGHHNFVAGDIVVHNSIEQDADVVMFIYRDELYHPETEKQNIADIILAKHRSGPTGRVELFFNKRLTQFLDATTRSVAPNEYVGRREGR